ncbi:hypothetical protein VNO80_01354 [Phaseolus coccineus]|uniref:Uncharacterized protein n=1 Tax=Phaseolus coccineus TaxID=3886 RepID=A0AAN9WYU5_PHACN
MARKPPTPPRPSSEMGQIARAMEMMATAIQQQNTVMAQIHQAVMHHLGTAGSAATAFPVNQLREQMGMTEFMRHNPTQFRGNVSPNQPDQWIREFHVRTWKILLE